MQRVHTTFDLLEAHILVGILRQHGVAVWAHDVEMVRQDWFKTIAFGGFRLVASDETATNAIDVLQRLQRGDFSLPDGDDEVCPRCSQPCVTPDAQPRRNFFSAWVVLSLTESAVWLSLKTLSATQIVALFVLQFLLSLSVPWLAIAYFKWCMRCTECNHRWRERPQLHSDLSKMADEAELAGR